MQRLSNQEVADTQPKRFIGASVCHLEKEGGLTIRGSGFERHELTVSDACSFRSGQDFWQDFELRISCDLPNPPQAGKVQLNSEMPRLMTPHLVQMQSTKETVRILSAELSCAMHQLT